MISLPLMTTQFRTCNAPREKLYAKKMFHDLLFLFPKYCNINKKSTSKVHKLPGNHSLQNW